jgi:hypothetical protein
MLIGEIPLQHWIDHFYGYGSWGSKIWFVALEEGGGDLPEEVAERINYFHDVHATATQPELCDIRDLYRQVAVRWEGARAGLFRNLHEYRFSEKAVLHGVWKNLIAFVHGYRNENVPDRLEYQKKSFALSSGGNESLIRLFPLPAPHNHGWYYSWLDLPPHFGFLKSRVSYQDHLYQRRMEGILNNIRAHKPEVVLMYGMGYINGLKQSVQEFFPGTKFKTAKAIKQQIPQHHLADIEGTKLIITTQIPALRHQRVETGFDWEKFGLQAAGY